MDLHFREYGSGAPLTILHGLLGSGGNWHTLSRARFSRSHRVVVPDLRNHGRSPHDSRFDYEAMANDVIALWDKLEIESSAVLGHSMGGKVAMHLALAYPERVSHLIVADMAPRAYQPGHEALLQALIDAAPQTHDSRASVEAFLAERIQDNAVRQFLLKNLERHEGGYRWQMNLEVIAANYDRVIEGLTVFATFEGPTLFIRGGNSPYVLDDDLPLIEAYFPSAELKTLLGTGHWLHAESPGAFADLVEEFLTQ
ncbi:MAG: alpha/beta fold hydrolase [Rhodothermales bacterium]|nr:alpha/beta fold hydrolase [Rhodothermales bacterium]